MFTATHLDRSARWPFRLGAALCVGLLLLLNWLAVDSDAHARLHAAHAHAPAEHADHSHEAPATPHDDADCVVTQFAHGATDLLLWAVFSFVILRRTPLRQWSKGVVRPDRAPFAWPAPSCGPPVGA